MEIKKYHDDRFDGLTNISCYKIRGNFIDNRGNPTKELLAFIMALKSQGSIFLTILNRIDGIDKLENVRDYLSKAHVNYIYFPRNKVRKILGIIPVYTAPTIHCLFEDENVMEFLLDKFWYGCDRMDICIAKKESANEAHEMLSVKVEQGIKKMPSQDLSDFLNLCECLVLKMWDGKSIEILAGSDIAGKLGKLVSSKDVPTVME